MNLYARLCQTASEYHSEQRLLSSLIASKFLLNDHLTFKHEPPHGFHNYRHHNTVKILLGIAPQGVLSFVSEPWGGRVSDKYLTEHCGILDKLHPGDIVLADRGFDISDSRNNAGKTSPSCIH